jgi:hypothetical protein
MKKKPFTRALRVVENVIAYQLAIGRYPDGETWRAVPPEEHLRHARAHLELLARGDGSEPHLEHAACRVLMALENELDREERKGEVRSE